ncbi:hypothetical protein [Planosporangium mesophilum]|uniref:hypothetical protein n=1 Tax=Planosporangium mesophilum TaxID=689768 RepID=UPI00143C6BB6|nr:hypothetical protein [Planosporangium mesophilum]NJC86589.1 hypothetical protein [Planosporangium mesophilum]
MNCPGVIDIVKIAGYYAQMTGVLAGFAFTALVVLLGPARPDEPGLHRTSRANGVPLVLLAAFIALTMSTLIYSVLAGESEQARGRAATVEIIDGVPFGLAVIMLFHGITLLMQGGDIDPVAVGTARVMTVVISPPLTLYYIANGAADTLSIHATRVAGECVATGVSELGLVLSVILVLVLAVSVIPKLQPRALRAGARKALRLVPISVLVVSLAATVAAGDLSTRSPDFLFSPTALDRYLVGIFVLLALLGLVLGLGRPEYRGPAGTRKRRSGTARPPLFRTRRATSRPSNPGSACSAA